MPKRPILISGSWRESTGTNSFFATNPATGAQLPDEYPVSSWQDCEEAIQAAASAAFELREMPGSRLADFLECYAEQIERRADSLVAMAHQETGYPESPRLRDIELPRTVNQLRLAATASRDDSWRHATIDTAVNIRSWLAAIGPVAVFGPNNFPFAFGSISGGDFAAAIAAGNPVIAKANSSHPGTTRFFAELADLAALETKMPAGTVQLIYRLNHADGERLVADPRIGATGYTGSRHAGLRLKQAADRAGNPIYLELSSVNPVVILPGALEARSSAIADEFVVSCLMGTGQFCTNPGFVLLIDSAASRTFVEQIAEKFAAAPAGILLSRGVQRSLMESLQNLQQAGAELLSGTLDAASLDQVPISCPNALLRITGQQFLEQPDTFQTEAFGNASLFVVAADEPQLVEILEQLEGNLTGSIYSAEDGNDEEHYGRVAPVLRRKVGRLLNDKMPTGVAVSPAMNHGGPYPATGHPGFTAVGIPAALQRFAVLECFDNVRHDRLPRQLQDKNPSGRQWRSIDGRWTTDDVASS
jgi:alpha-ketoglutaric semialdehyde dehydrogenase